MVSHAPQDCALTDSCSCLLQRDVKVGELIYHVRKYVDPDIIDHAEEAFAPEK